MLKRIDNEKDWIKAINNLKGIKLKANKRILKEAIIKSIKKNVPIRRFGILFSGGIDSTLIALICKKLKKDFICYCVGLENSEDLEYAKRIEKELKLKLKIKEFNLDQANLIIRNITKTLNTNNVVNVGVGSVLYSAIKLARRDKIKHFFSGLGSEEIFAGYQRHELAKDINKECWKGLKQMWKRDFIRDFTITEKLRVNLLLPFLDEEVIKVAMNIPAKQKINKSYKKIILRQIAIDLGLKKEFAYRKKKAAQYGSKFDRAILRLARRNKFRYKKDYLGSFLK